MKRWRNIKVKICGNQSFEDLITLCISLDKKIERIGNIYICPFCKNTNMFGGKRGLISHINNCHVHRIDEDTRMVLVDTVIDKETRRTTFYRPNDKNKKKVKV